MMTDLPLHLASADYMRLLPLAAGLVQPRGIALTLTLGRSGSWDMRNALMGGVNTTDDFHGGESSMGAHLIRMAKGDRSMVALPVFVLRGFIERDLYVRRGGPVQQPSDLAGRRVGLYSWGASGAIWYRQAMDRMGISPDAVQWVVGDVNQPGESKKVVFPAHVETAPKPMSKMLADGKIDALWSPPLPNGFDPVAGPVIRMFPDSQAEEEAGFRTTGIFPPMHLIILRRAVWEANPWIAPALTEAFEASDAAFDSAQDGFPDAAPWMYQERARLAGLMGARPYGHGLTVANCHALRTFAATAHRYGLIDRMVEPEEYFAEYLASPRP
jgi:4,5-dihydroxyphthalate decarboxylase